MFDFHPTVKQVLVITMDASAETPMETPVEATVHRDLGRDCAVRVSAELDHRPAVFETFASVDFLGPRLRHLDNTIHEIVTVCAAREIPLLIRSQGKHAVEVMLTELMPAARRDALEDAADEARHFW